jgi:large conductance mechanosensitive channel protein
MSYRMSIAKEFREFAVKGNVMDLAVGVIIGAAFGKIVARSSRTSSCRRSASLLGAEFQRPRGQGRLGDLKYGKFLQTCLDFFLIALAVIPARQADQPHQARGREARRGKAPVRKCCWRKFETCFQRRRKRTGNSASRGAPGAGRAGSGRAHRCVIEQRVPAAPFQPGGDDGARAIEEQQHQRVACRPRSIASTG